MRKYLSFFILVVGLFISISATAEDKLTPIGSGSYNYWSDWYNSLVVVGDNGVLVVDPAWDERSEKIKNAVAKITDKPVTHIVLTHEHYDHVGGTGVFKDAEIVCHATCSKFFELDVMGITPKQITTTFESDLTIDLGNKKIELTHMGAADGVATTIVYVPSDKVVATADLYSKETLIDGIWLDDKNYLGTRKILNELAQWPIDHALSGHAETTDPAILKENAAYLNDLYTAVKNKIDLIMKEGGPSAVFGAIGKDLPNQIKLPQYAHWKGYEKNLPKHVVRMAMSIMHGG